jgi:RNA polymerase sigma-70 factor (ECF subfamily)
VELDQNIAGHEDPTADVERALDRGELQVALSQLTDEQRQVIILRFIEGFDNATVARALSRSQGAVKSLQHRALGSLRRILAEGRA